MTAVVSRERAARTGLTAAAGALMLAVAFVMMVVAAPGHGHVRVQQAKPSAARLSTDLCHLASPILPARPADTRECCDTQACSVVRLS